MVLGPMMPSSPAGSKPLAKSRFCISFFSVKDSGLSPRGQLPLIAPALVSGWLLAFTLSWDDVVISQFVSGPNSTTLPMVIFSKARLGVSPDINALATIMVLIVATGVVLSTIWMKRQERRRLLEEQMARSDAG